MIPGPDEVLACPMCTGSIRRRTILSGNTFRSKRWSDGRLDAPMLPSLVRITRCAHCNHIVWLDDGSELGVFDEFDPSDRERTPEWEEAPVAQELDTQGLIEALEWNPIPERETVLRIKLWQKHNDAIREEFSTDCYPNTALDRTSEKLWKLIYKQDRPLSDRAFPPPGYDENLEKLLKLLDPTDDDNYLLYAEILRELGRCPEAADFLTSRELLSVEALELLEVARVGYWLPIPFRSDDGRFKFLNSISENLSASYNLALCYLNGRGVAQDESFGILLLSSQADSGFLPALRKLAECNRDGIGCDQNLPYAANLFRQGAEKGDAVCQFSLALLIDSEEADGELEDAFLWYSLAAAQGLPDAQFHLGVCFSAGYGVEENQREAVVWLKRAAETGHAEAQLALGHCYADGTGIDQDYETAIYWYRGAIAAGNSDALVALGQRYIRGDGIPKDYDTARDLFTQAAEQGLSSAVYRLGVMAELGQGQKIDFVAAMNFYKQAAKNNDDNAMFKIGLFNEYGLGLEQNMKIAIKFYKKAASRFNPQAIWKLDEYGIAPF